MKAPIEAKVIAAAGGAGLGGAFGTFVLWLLGVFAWGCSAAADKATVAVAAVPQPVAALIVIVIALVGAAIGGYEAPHTARPDLAAKAAPADPVTPAAPVETAPAVSTPAEPEAPAAGVPPAADAAPQA